jgi:hypothetical protein
VCITISGSYIIGNSLQVAGDPVKGDYPRWKAFYDAVWHASLRKSLAIYRDLALSDVVDEYEEAMRSFPVR